jgi:hypothetical protein
MLCVFRGHATFLDITFARMTLSVSVKPIAS